MFCENSITNIKEEPYNEVIKIEADPQDDGHFYDEKPFEFYDQNNEFNDQSNDFNEDFNMQGEDYLEESDFLWNCEKCEKSFNSRQNWIRHNQTVHGNVKCQYCNEIYENKDILTIHMKKIHSKDLVKKRGWSRCKVCNEVFPSKQLREEHEIKDHEHLKGLIDFTPMPRFFNCDSKEKFIENWYHNKIVSFTPNFDYFLPSFIFPSPKYSLCFLKYWF